MKKIFFSAIAAFLIISCNDKKSEDGGSTQETKFTGKTVNNLENEDQKAAYAFGITMGQEVENVSSNQVFGDSLNYEQVKKGLIDYWSGDSQKNSYAYGQQIGLSVDNLLKKQNANNFDKDIMLQAMMNFLNKDSLLISEEQVMVVLNDYMSKKFELAKTTNLEEGQKFLEEQKQKEGVKSTNSGLLYEVIKEGDGKSPVATDIVKVKYEGKLINGTIFDSTEKNNEGEAIEFPLNRVIPGWTEGMQLMKEGGKYRFYIPSNLAYGERGAGSDIGPNQALIFEVELLEVKPANEEAAPAPGN